MRKKKIISLVIAIIALFGLFSVTYFMTERKTKPAEYQDKTAQFVHESPNSVLNRLEKRKQGIYYFGFPTCPWCIELLPVLDGELKSQSTAAFIVNTHSNDFSDKEKTALEEFFLKHTKENEMSVPFVAAINSRGKIETHVGTVPTHDAKKRKMTAKERVELENILSNMIRFSEQ